MTNPIERALAQAEVIVSENKRLEHLSAPKRIVSVLVTVPSLVTAEDAQKAVQALVQNGIEVWEDSGGQCGFTIEDETGTRVYDQTRQVGRSVTVESVEVIA